MHCRPRDGMLQTWRAAMCSTAPRPQQQGGVAGEPGWPWAAGVDNGQLWFDHVRVPRDALLDAFASVAADGAYSSAIPSVSQRFGTMVGGLTTGARFCSRTSTEFTSMQGVSCWRFHVLMYCSRRPLPAPHLTSPGVQRASGRKDSRPACPTDLCSCVVR